MAYCSNCGTSVSENSTFCAICRTPILLGGAGTATPDFARPEEKGRRVLAYLIDIIPMLLFSTLHFVPIVGWMAYGALHLVYWLIRDIGGASLGKMVLGSFVASQDGGPSTDSQRIVRNIPLALPGLIGLIPVVGIFFELGLAVLIVGVEAILLLATGRRFGDRLANTMVFRR